MILASDNDQTQVSVYSAPVTIFPDTYRPAPPSYQPCSIAEPVTDWEALQHLELLMRPA